jgi:ferrous iron transport protein B
MKKLKIALIGNPNSGKTTVFNHLTGYRYKIANYPGVTVEKKTGIKKVNDIELEIIDLPGLYSLNPTSEDEKIANNYIMQEKPDVIINIIDASNLEKSLFLTTQLMELGRPVVLALNMIDIAEKRNLKIDIDFLKNILEVEIVALVASKKKGIEDLLNKAVHVAKKKISYGINVKFDNLIEKEIKKIESLFFSEIDLKEKRLYAIKLLQEEPYFLKKIDNDLILRCVKQKKDFLEKKYRDHIEIILSKNRYEFINSILKKAIYKQKEYQKTKSDKIDEILTHKLFGFPIFLLLMFFVFQFTFFIGSYPMVWIGELFKFLASFISNIWPESVYILLRSLVINGIITGIGTVVVFLPNILILFFCISLLEDSGYMARVSFILDRLMHKIGLHGKSFIPMVIGFGCSVPAIMSTRFMESKKDRLVTILALPLIACSAKLVVFTLLIPAFFTRPYQPVILFSLYLIGIILAIIVIRIFKSIFKKQSFSFVMELPSYKLPSFFTTITHMWDKSKEYLKKAGTLIFGFSIILWALGSFPTDKKNISESYLGKIGKAIQPVFKPLGFDWKVDTSLISSFASKEVFIAQLGIIYAIKDSTDVKQLQEDLKKDYSPLQAFCIMLFILISTPCIATIAITKKETNSFKWAFFQFLYLTVLAYFVTFFVYQIGSIFIG